MVQWQTMILSAPPVAVKRTPPHRQPPVWTWGIRDFSYTTVRRRGLTSRIAGARAHAHVRVDAIVRSQRYTHPVPEHLSHSLLAPPSPPHTGQVFHCFEYSGSTGGIQVLRYIGSGARARAFAPALPKIAGGQARLRCDQEPTASRPAISMATVDSSGTTAPSSENAPL